MSGYSKLDCGIVDSSLWEMPHSYLRVWIAMLAKCDASGYVRVAAPAMARLCHLDRSEFDQIVEAFCSPDKESRTPDHEGRRLEKVDGGWMILNYLKYREGLKQPDSSTERTRKYREKLKVCDGSTVTDRHTPSRDVPVTPKQRQKQKHKQEDISAPHPRKGAKLDEPEAVSEKWEFPVKSQSDDPKSWHVPIASLDTWTDVFGDRGFVEREIGLARAWLLANPAKRKTPVGMNKFLFGWLERANNRGRAGGAVTGGGRLPKAEQDYLDHMKRESQSAVVRARKRLEKLQEAGEPIREARLELESAEAELKRRMEAT